MVYLETVTKKLKQAFKIKHISSPSLFEVRILLSFWWFYTDTKWNPSEKKKSWCKKTQISQCSACVQVYKLWVQTDIDSLAFTIDQFILGDHMLQLCKDKPLYQYLKDFLWGAILGFRNCSLETTFLCTYIFKSLIKCKTGR